MKSFTRGNSTEYLIRNLIFELIHFGLMLQPAIEVEGKPGNASQRISLLFLEFLERQFPIDDSHTNIQLRTASDFAGQLNIQVTHLNRAVKETTEKTTPQFIGERLLKESRILLKHSAWNVSEVAYALGFSEVTHFNNFFKKTNQHESHPIPEGGGVKGGCDLEIFGFF